MGAVPTMTMRNAVHCNNCDKTIESFHRHDFRRCACVSDDTAVWVDGGREYSRRMFGKDCDYIEITDKFIPEPEHTLEHSDAVLRNVHASGQCWGEHCTIHNMSEHSKRSWVQHWNPAKQRMERISPKTGRHYKDPDSP